MDSTNGKFVCVDMEIFHSGLHKLRASQYSRYMETNALLLPWLGLRRTTFSKMGIGDDRSD